MYDTLSKSALSERERRVRSELCRLLSSAVLIKGSLSRRATVCGKSGCRCTRGQKHTSVCLVAYDKGALRQQHVPRALHARVRTWVSTYRTVQALLDRLSGYAWQRLKQR
jgi:hypothetical protein